MARYPLLDDADWLRTKYEVERLSTTEIARLAGVPNDNASTARKALLRHGIALRPVGRQRGSGRIGHTEKACTKCRVVKPLSEFHLNTGLTDGRASQCKICAGKNANETVRKLRERVVATLGGMCVWEGCGITDVRILTLDHVNGGGNKVRKTGNRGWGYYKAMLDHPEEFQVLCWNHQHLKRILNEEHRRRPAELLTPAGKR